MPSFEIEFEVYCGTCGEGICHRSEGRNSRNRSFPQVVVDVCEVCIDHVTNPLEDEIEDLKKQIERLEKALEDASIRT